LSWSRSRGLFAGLSLEGSTLRPDERETERLYGQRLTNQEILETSVTTPNLEVLMADHDKCDSKKTDRRKSRRGEDRRVHPRYDFFARCELADKSSGTLYEGRVTQIATGCCFVDLPVVLPQGTDVVVRITKEGRAFEAEGRATYNYASMGIGIAFTSLSQENQQTLEDWIKRVAG
jgi:hypothetical protein